MSSSSNELFTKLNMFALAVNYGSQEQVETTFREIPTENLTTKPCESLIARMARTREFTLVNLLTERNLNAPGRARLIKQVIITHKDKPDDALSMIRCLLDWHENDFTADAYTELVQTAQAISHLEAVRFLEKTARNAKIYRTFCEACGPDFTFQSTQQALSDLRKNLPNTESLPEDVYFVCAQQAVMQSDFRFIQELMSHQELLSISAHKRLEVFTQAVEKYDKTKLNNDNLLYVIDLIRGKGERFLLVQHLYDKYQKQIQPEKVSFHRGGDLIRTISDARPDEVLKAVADIFKKGKVFEPCCKEAFEIAIDKSYFALLPLLLSHIEDETFRKDHMNMIRVASPHNLSGGSPTSASGSSAASAAAGGPNPSPVSATSSSLPGG